MNASATSVAVRTRGGGAGSSSRRALSRQIASTMPVSDGPDQRARVDLRGRARTRRRASSPRVASRRDESTSAGVQRTEYEPFDSRALPLRALALAQQRDHRAVRGELDRPDRDAAQPAHARADLLADLAGARGDQPAEHLADGDRQRVGAASRRAAAPRRGASSPCSARRPRSSISASSSPATGGAAARRPRDDAARLPRHLQLRRLGRTRRRRLLLPRALALLAAPVARRSRSAAEAARCAGPTPRRCDRPPTRGRRRPAPAPRPGSSGPARGAPRLRAAVRPGKRASRRGRLRALRAGRPSRRRRPRPARIARTPSPRRAAASTSYGRARRAERRASTPPLGVCRLDLVSRASRSAGCSEDALCALEEAWGLAPRFGHPVRPCSTATRNSRAPRHPRLRNSRQPV